MNELLTNPAFTALLAAIVGTLTGYFTRRVEKAPDIQTSLNTAVAGITGHYQAALTAATVQMEAMRIEIASLRKTVEDQSEVIGDLETHIDSLTDAMVAAGVKPPVRSRKKS